MYEAKPYRRLETRIKPGASFTLDTGVIIHNPGPESVRLVVKTPVQASGVPSEKSEPIK